MKSNKDKSDEDKDGMKRVGREAKERMSSQMENRKKRKNIRCACFALLALGIVSVAFWGYRFAPYDPLETNFTQKLMPPSMAHPFGIDNVGRDVLSRVLCGAGNSFKLVFLMLRHRSSRKKCAKGDRIWKCARECCAADCQWF